MLVGFLRIQQLLYSYAHALQSPNSRSHLTHCKRMVCSNPRTSLILTVCGFTHDSGETELVATADGRGNNASRDHGARAEICRMGRPGFQLVDLIRGTTLRHNLVRRSAGPFSNVQRRQRCLALIRCIDVQQRLVKEWPRRVTQE